MEASCTSTRSAGVDIIFGRRQRGESLVCEVLSRLFSNYNEWKDRAVQDIYGSRRNQPDNLPMLARHDRSGRNDLGIWRWGQRWKIVYVRSGEGLYQSL